MRAFAWLGVVLSLILSLPALAQDNGVPDRRIVYGLGVDFYGSDLQPIFDTTFDACHRACLSQQACAAVTFNTRSGACFPKTGITRTEAYEGAISGRVVQTSAQHLTTAAAQRAKVPFVSDGQIDAAAAVVSEVSRRFFPGEATLDDLEIAFSIAADRATIYQQVDIMGRLTILSDRAEDWVEYGRLTAELAETAGNQRRQERAHARAALWAGFLRGGDASIQVAALSHLAELAEREGRGRDGIAYLTLAQTIAPQQDTASALARLQGLYGFRVTDTQVDSNAADPRICLIFNERLVARGVDYAPFVQSDVTGLAVEAKGNQLCLSGLDHGVRYRFTLRRGLPAEDGQSLLAPIEVTQYVRDRAPAVRFPGRAYVLPRTADAGVPVVTTNIDSLDLRLYQVSDRNLVRGLQNRLLSRTLDAWSESDFSRDMGQEVWSGQVDLTQVLNQDVTSRIPLAGPLSDLAPGVYVLQAATPGAAYDAETATQWFVLSDIGLSTWQGVDGLHVFARSLADAGAKAGLTLSLVSEGNAVLGQATTDGDGYAVFPPGLTRGTGAARAALLTAEGGDDLVYLSLRSAGFDLSDRGVEGRDPAGPLDAFLTTDRGAYRAGEVIHATVLLRDADVLAVPGVPVTAVLRRPDGVEYTRLVSAQGQAGGHVFALPLAGDVPRGTWRLEVLGDPQAPALAEAKLLVEDFVPDRIEVLVDLPEGPVPLSGAVPMDLQARYLFGAPAADLPVEGSVALRPARQLAALPGWQFGLHDSTAFATSDSLGRGLTTGPDGRLALPIGLPQVEEGDRPWTGQLTARVAEPSGRPVETTATFAVEPEGPFLGLKPLFDDVVAEGGAARFEVAAFAPDLTRTGAQVQVTVNRIERRYQWYRLYGQWNWEPVTTRTRVSSQTLTLTADALGQVEAPVDWGLYEVVVERLDGPYAATSVDFWAGWFAPADSSATPDTLELSLNAPEFAPGDTAQVRVVPRAAGTALITVVSNRLIDKQVVELSAGENLIELPVTDAWGTGAYVMATLIRPLDAGAGRLPTRAVGLAHAAIDPGPKVLPTVLSVPEVMRPRGPLTIGLQTDLPTGAQAWATVAAVDVGILNLTSHAAPDPEGHYFGQRKLGMDLRDVYGRLIDGMNGQMAALRSGGDAGAGLRRQAPPPTEDLVAYFSGPVEIGADGRAEVRFEIPAFNGTVRVMAVTWTDRAVGQAAADVIVRDPVVMTASVPRFLQPGDRSVLRLDLTHAEGPAGEMQVAVDGDAFVAVDGGAGKGVLIGEQGQAQITLPLTALAEGVAKIALRLTTPAGEVLTKTLTIPVDHTDAEIGRTEQIALAPGQSFTLDPNIFDGFALGSGRVIVSGGPLARFDAPGLLAMLDRYPYGCTEQITSRAMPLLYANDVAMALGLEVDQDLTARVEGAIASILTNQSSSGTFGLWRAGSGDLWLNAYVTDFLSRARQAGYAVPGAAFDLALDHLRNAISFAPDFERGGEGVAYALYVLAREGAAAAADLRYYADVKAADFGSALAVAQLGAALAAYGDPVRADQMFRAATARLAGATSASGNRYRGDYGTVRRDAAAVLTLAAEAGSQAVETHALTNLAAAQTGRGATTQEAAWSILAANALVGDVARAPLSLDGVPLAGPLVQLHEAATLTPMTIRNDGTAPVPLTLNIFGAPDGVVDPGGGGYTIDRRYYDLEGRAIDPTQVDQGARLVTVLTITPLEDMRARLMVNDPLPAGFEIDNPNLLRAGDIAALGWLQPETDVRMTEARQDRFLAALDRRDDTRFQLAYIVRAVSPGVFHHPAATVEDMYRPDRRARTASGRVTVTP